MYPGCDVVMKKAFVIPETLHVITFLCHTSHIMYIGGARRKLKGWHCYRSLELV